MITFDLANKRKVRESLSAEVNAAGFWDDRERARKSMARLSQVEGELSRYDSLAELITELEEMNSIGVEEDDPSFEEEVEEGIASLEERIREIEDDSLLQGEFDANNAIVLIHSGAGGLESQDWAEMLMRMYLRWMERRGYKVALNDIQPGEGGGLKSCTLTVSGQNAFGYLLSEKGVHRLVRISPFDSAKRRHTSFASVDVIPEVGEEAEIEIDAKDLRIDTYRSSGAGGQHVNVTDSAVRITHLPTNTVVQVQNERSQTSNKTIAMKILKSRLFQIAQKEREKELESIRGQRMDIGWGSQIRSYVFHPYQMVKDHRTNLEVGNVNAVMDGEIDGFIEEGLRWLRKQESGRQREGAEDG